MNFVEQKMRNKCLGKGGVNKNEEEKKRKPQLPQGAVVAQVLLGVILQLQEKVPRDASYPASPPLSFSSFFRACFLPSLTSVCTHIYVHVNQYARENES